MVNFELGEKFEKVLFRLVTSVGQSKKNQSPHAESNLRPSDLVLKISNHLSSS